MSSKDRAWLSSVSEKPPDNILDSDDTTEGIMDVDENSDSLSRSLESSDQSTSLTSSVSIKNYASSNQVKNFHAADDKENEELTTSTEDDSLEKNARNEKKLKARLEQPITPVLRRSSRANKGIGKEIFDPSHIPAAQKKYYEPKRFDSPNTERSSSPSSSVHSSPSFKRGRMVVGRSPKRRTDKLEKNTVKEEKRGRGRPRGSKKTATTSDKPQSAPMSKDDFSDDDDNVPLKLLKDDDDDDSSSELESDSVEKLKESRVNKSNKTAEEKYEEMMEEEPPKKNVKIEEKFENIETAAHTKNEVAVKDDTTVKSDDNDKSDSDDDYSSSDDSDDSYNNPERLWCICRKPHNNRFMISCDQCEDWFHGDCVGISLQQGRKMEENNEEYICPKCLKSKDQRYYKDISYKPEPDTKEKKLQKRSADEAAEVKVHKRSAALDEKLKARRTLKGYAFGQMQSATIKKESSAGDVNAKTTTKEKEKFEPADGKKTPESDSSSRKCIVSSCLNDALPGSVYCSNQCILKHAKESLMSVVKDKKDAEGKPKLTHKDSKEKPPDGKPKALNPNRRISVICRKTRKILTGPAAPRRKDLAAFLKKYPTYKVYRPPPSSQEVEKVREKPAAKPSSADFYKHVESQHRKRDRYGADEHSTTARKVTDSGFLLEKKHRVIKAAGQLAPNVSKPSGGEATAKSSHIASNKSKHLYKQPEQGHKQHKPTTSESSKKQQDVSKPIERRSSKDRKRKHSNDSKDERAVKKVERSPSSGSKPKPDTSEIRQNIKKSLFDILKSRSENSEDLKMHPDSIMRLAAKIEDSLFKVYNDTNMKYKTKYRSMMFNLKDARNHGLWRKVIIGEVTTAEFVLMTAEQMASKKLAEWRKNELTQELDIIKKQEKEIANIRPVAKITHKGEIAIQEDLSDMTENFSKRDSTSAPTIAPARKKRISLSEEDPFEGSASAFSQDTTSQHHEHLFDLNCKICTGKVKEEDVEQPDTPTDAGKKVKRSTSIILSAEAQHANALAEKDDTPTSHIVITDKTRDKKKKKRKTEEDIESNINSHDPSLSPTTFLSNLSNEKKKKKITLPSPPPLSDIAERQTDPDLVSAQETPEEKSPAKETTKPEKKQEVVKTQFPPKVADTPVQTPRPTKSKLIWSGSISMLDLSTFKANVYPANGVCDNLDIDLPVRLVLGGRIDPKVVWEYLEKISVHPTKQLSVVRFHAASDDDRVGYVAMLSYFSSRKRFGVVSNQDRMLVKDMYLIPLLESHPIPEKLSFCSPGIEDAFPPNRPSMLLGIVVRQISAKPLQPIFSTSDSTPPAVQHPPPLTKSAPDEDDEEYIPDDDPPLKERTLSPAPLLTDEELAAKTEVKPQSSGSSLLERNRSLAPSLRFFMRKQSEEEQIRREQEEAIDNDDDRPYSPGEDIEQEESVEEEEYDPEEGIEQDDEDEPYDPEKMYEEQEEYDPETAFAPESPKRDDDAPYDPEDAEDLMADTLDSSEVQELAEKKAFIERMQRELEEKKAKLAQVEQSLQKSAAIPSPAPPASVPEKVEKPRIMDPRLARRAATQETDKSTSAKKSVDSSSTVDTPASTAASSSAVLTTSSSSSSEAVSPSKSNSVTPSSNLVAATPKSVDVSKVPPLKSPDKGEASAKMSKEADIPKEKADSLKVADPPKPVDPLQTILSVLNMAQQTNTQSSSSVAGALKIFQKQSSPPPLPDSTTKSDPEDGEGADKLKKDGKTGDIGDNAPSPDSRTGDDDIEKKKSKKSDQKRHRSSSASSSSSRDDNRKRHRHDYDDKHHSKRHRRSRSRSPHHRSRHHHRHHDEHRRRHHDRSWSRDRRR